MSPRRRPRPARVRRCPSTRSRCSPRAAAGGCSARAWSLHSRRRSTRPSPTAGDRERQSGEEQPDARRRGWARARSGDGHAGASHTDTPTRRCLPGDLSRFSRWIFYGRVGHGRPLGACADPLRPAAFLSGADDASWLETTYLSDKVRLGRGNKGSIFVLRRLDDGGGAL